MKKNTSIFYSFLVVLLSCNFLTAQSGDINFSLISIEQGLSQSTVFSILQDKRGFMWFGTNDGLNRYDGYKMTVYKPDPSKPNSLCGNRVFVIYEDHAGNLWIGTDGGLNKYNRDKENFTHFVHNPANRNSLPNNHITSINEDDNGILWIGTNYGLCRFDTHNNSFKNYVNNPRNKFSLSNNFVWSVHNDKKGNIWIGTDSLLNKFVKREERFYRFGFAPPGQKKVAQNTIFSICQDNANNLWIGTRNGLNKFNMLTNRFIHLMNETGNKNSISHNNVYSLLVDKKQNLWVGTLGGGLNKLEPGNNTQNRKQNYTFSHYLTNPQNTHSLSNNYVWSVYEDKAGALWIGTDIGLNRYDPQLEKFSLFRNNPFNKNSLCENVVTSLLEDRKGMLWIGTIHGLDLYNPSTQNYTHFVNNPANKSTISNNYIRSIFEDKNGTIWIGTNGGGLNKYDRRSNKFTKYTYDPQNPNSLTDDKIISICQDREGILWLGTLGGLTKFDPVKIKFTRYKNDPNNNASLSHNYVFSVFEDSRGELWIGTSNGLNRFNKKTNKFTRYFNEFGNPNSISNNLIMAIHEDKKGNIWIGTNGGLNKFDKTAQKFTRFTENDVLYNDVIYGILEDNNGYLWLSTNKGLARLNPATKKIRNFTKDDGLQSNQFSTGACFKSSGGKMYFGGISGFNAFYPENITKNNYVPPIVMTDLQILNKSVGIDNGSVLTKSITETSQIELSYKENVFSFEFAALSYTLPQYNEYAYMMEGFDKNWINSGSRRYVTYTNLDPGYYTFKVKGANNDGVWNNTGIQIRIYVAPPFWKTWWFILLSAVLILSVIAFIISYRMKSLLAVERIRFNIASDLHDDLGTHLTEISMLSDIAYTLAETNTQAEKDMVKKIGGIARQLIDRMSDIVWLINPKRDSLSELFIKIKDNFEENLSYSNILLHFSNLDFLDKVKLPMEYRKNLYLIFKEAMNNSVKHSSCKNIWIDVKEEKKILQITLKDDGKGFDFLKNSQGNGFVNMKTRAETVGGKLEIKSSVSNGTEVQFRGKI